MAVSPSVAELLIHMPLVGFRDRKVRERERRERILGLRVRERIISYWQHTCPYSPAESIHTRACCQI